VSILPIELMWNRVEKTRESSALDFEELLYLGETIFKTYVVGIVAAVDDDPDRLRYKLAYRLVRGNSLGDWDDVLSELSTGTPAQHLRPAAVEAHRELTARHGEGSWLHEAVTCLHSCLRRFLPDTEALPSKFDGRKWFSQFVYLRNKTRGHGAPTEEQKLAGSLDLERSLRLMAENCKVFHREWVFLKRNLSLKYNVIPLGVSTKAFDELKSDKSRSLSFADGVYIDFGQPVRVELIDSTAELVEFFYPNGHFRSKKMEWLSYVSGTRKDIDGSAYLAPTSELPKSHTEGDRLMRVVGRCFANLPPLPKDYISRTELESELESVLSNDRHPVITLVGRGGIGKTSLALKALHHLAESENDRFIGIIWLSARDIDLLPTGAKLVKPSVLSVKDIAREIVDLLQPKESNENNFDKEEYVAGILRSYGQDALLIVFDNFETVQQPLDVFNWLDQNIRSPNKILITTRHRDFRGDYAVEVGGMTEPQCNELVRATASAIGLQTMVTTDFCREVYRESEGHPYVVKVLVGESAEGGRFRKVERIVASREEILDALFERTYARLSPPARRVFLTLCNWRSLVPIVAMEAALLRPTIEDRIDTQAAVEELRRVSFVDEFISAEDRSAFLSVPLVAAVFGKRKLTVSQERVAIEDDTRFLQRFGAIQPPDVNRGLAPRIHRLFASLSGDLEKGRLRLDEEGPTLELIARQYPPAWLLISQLWAESGKDPGSANTKAAVMRYLELTPPTATDQNAAWQRLAELSRSEKDWLGFVNAVVHIAELPGADLPTISGAVNTFNSVNRELESDPAQKRAFAKRLVSVMEPKIGEGDATDCSRLGWLFLQLGNRNRVRDIVQSGLRLDPNNDYCRNLEARLALET
jgi:NB-ARC domain